MNAFGEEVATRSSNKPKRTNYVGTKAYPPGSDVKVTKADGTVEWVPSKKKEVKNYGEVKFSEKSE